MVGIDRRPILDDILQTSVVAVAQRPGQRGDCLAQLDGIGDLIDPDARLDAISAVLGGRASSP